MVGVKLSSTAAIALSLLTPVLAASVDPIIIKGNHFFYKTNGTQLSVILCPLPLSPY